MIALISMFFSSGVYTWQAKVYSTICLIRLVDTEGLSVSTMEQSSASAVSSGQRSGNVVDLEEGSKAAMLKKLKIPCAQVSHQQQQYAVQLRRAPRPKLS